MALNVEKLEDQLKLRIYQCIYTLCLFVLTKLYHVQRSKHREDLCGTLHEIKHLVETVRSILTMLTIEYLEWPFPVHSRLCGWSYLIYFLIGKLSYSSSSEPRRTVLYIDHRCDVYNGSPPQE